MFSELVKYGGVATKVRAMYGNRIKREDYVRMAGLQSVSDVASYLKGHPAYSDTLGTLQVSGITRKQLETALNNDLMEEYFRILSFCGREDAAIMRYLAVKLELHEVMRFMRLAEAGRSSDYVFSLPPYFNKYSKIRYNLLTSAVNYQDMLEAVKETQYYAVLTQLELRPSGFPDYTSVEVAIESSYFRWMFSTIKRQYVGMQQESLMEFIGTQVDIMNITTIIRLRKNFPKALDNVYKYLIPANHRLKPAIIKQLLSSQDVDAMLNVLKNSGFAKYFAEKEHASLSGHYYYPMIAYSLRQLRSGSPNISAPLAYLFLKELEINNLISLIECVRYNVPVEKTMSYIYVT